MSALPSTLNSTAFEKHYSVSEVAELWGTGSETVRRLFQDEPGVLKISMPRMVSRKHRPHVTLRIPASVLARVHEQRSSGLGLKIQPRRSRIK